MSWGRYIIQDWGQHTCSEGQPILTLEECINATREFNNLCPVTQVDKALPLEEVWDGPRGCHMQRYHTDADVSAAQSLPKNGGIFRFNSNFDGDRGAPDHGPICMVERDIPGWVTDDVRASCPRYLLG